MPGAPFFNGFFNGEGTPATGRVADPHVSVVPPRQNDPRRTLVRASLASVPVRPWRPGHPLGLDVRQALMTRTPRPVTHLDASPTNGTLPGSPFRLLPRARRLRLKISRPGTSPTPPRSASPTVAHVTLHPRSADQDGGGRDSLHPPSGTQKTPVGLRAMIERESSRHRRSGPMLFAPPTPAGSAIPSAPVAHPDRPSNRRPRRQPECPDRRAASSTPPQSAAPTRSEVGETEEAHHHQGHRNKEIHPHHPEHRTTTHRAR